MKRVFSIIGATTSLVFIARKKIQKAFIFLDFCLKIFLVYSKSLIKESNNKDNNKDSFACCLMNYILQYILITKQLNDELERKVETKEYSK